jgi:putative acetyltransferase
MGRDEETSTISECNQSVRVGRYPASCHAGGGFVWDAVLEYRVWCHPERGAPGKADGSDYYYAFASYPMPSGFRRNH